MPQHKCQHDIPHYEKGAIPTMRIAPFFSEIDVLDQPAFWKSAANPWVCNRLIKRLIPK